MRIRFGRMPGAILAALATALVAAPVADGAVVFSGSPATGSPPATLGGYAMTPFAADSQQLFDNVTSVASPLSGSLTFSPALDHVVIGNGWSTWSNGYTGDVYVNYSSDPLTITLPSGTGAFYLYSEPDFFGTFDITATAQDGTSSGAVPVSSDSGASFFGFYGTNGDTLSSITVSADPSAGGFAIGEFGIGNSAAPSGPQFGQLLAAVQGAGPGNSLAAKVSAAQADYAAGRSTAACGVMGAFVNAVNAQTAKKIPAAQAATLLADAQAIESAMGC